MNDEGEGKIMKDNDTVLDISDMKYLLIAFSGWLLANLLWIIPLVFVWFI
jgi:hypothetical protein